jgi:pimeloyl-ACP methyl ester carboxylesterase
VALPQTSVPVGLISFQHGTIVAHADAPSALSASDQELILYAALASPGFIAAIPDYLGFGSSADILHPYYVKDATSTAVLDLVVAAKELAVLKKVNFNGKLFLAGYSEGGYATMAAHRAIEQKPIDGISLVASFPASGGYDVKGMQKYFFSLPTYGQPFFLAYGALAYQNYYQWTAPLSKFFQEPYASLIPGLFNGSNDGSQINAALTDDVTRLVSTDLLAHVDTDTQYQYIVDAFNENSLLDWKPTIKMFLYHGDADTTVPFQNSVDTYNRLIANGTSTTILTLTPLAGKDHETGVQPYIEDIIPKILSMQ